MSIVKEVMQTLQPKGGALNAAWTYQAQSPILAPPIVIEHDGEVIIAAGTKDGRLVALDALGKKQWEFSATRTMSKVDQLFMDEDTVKAVFSMPQLVPGNPEPLLIFGTESGALQAITLQGKKAWEFKAKGAVRTSPLIADINDDGAFEIVFGSSDRSIYALSRVGKLLWTYQADGPIESSPAFFKSPRGGGIAFGTSTGTVHCLTTDGKLRWTYQTKSAITAQPSCGRIKGTDEVYVAVGCHDNKLYVLNELGALEWQFETQGKIVAAATLRDINTDNRMEVCVGSTDDSIYMLSDSGGVLWQFETNFWVAAQPLITDINNDGRLEVLAGSYDKNLYVLAAEGEFLLESMPGTSNITADFGNVTGLISAPSGTYHSKVMARYHAGGMVTGIAKLGPKTCVITTTSGTIEAIHL